MCEGNGADGVQAEVVSCSEMPMATSACPAVTRGVRSWAGERAWRTRAVVRLMSMAHSVIQVRACQVIRARSSDDGVEEP